MFHLSAFFKALSAATDVALTAVPDQIANADSGDLYFQGDMQVQALVVLSPTVTRARLTSPKLKQVAVPYIIPLIGGAIPPDDPNVMDLRENPITLRGLERFNFEVTESAAGPENCTALIFTSPGMLGGKPSGEITTLRGTGTTTAVVNSWTDVSITWDQQLARGRYAIVGGHLFSVNAIAWRLILENQVWRPGALGINALIRRTHAMFYNGGLGVWGEFFSTGLPRVQLMANVADTAYSLFLQVIRVGA